ncbi:MAG: hypothetical protein IJY89_01050 [Clostridia bacterium]|nr:hypothetical protein [Clostridia bacterium]
MTVSDGGLPITALCSYKDGVLVFRENAMQMIKGDGAPFAVKDLYKTGTANSKSVKEASGILYFISGDRVARYNGNSLSFLPPLPEGTTLPGCAGVLEGKYCFYALQGQRRLLYTYHPEIDAYSVAELFLDVKEFVSCGEKLYMLASEEGKPNGLYCLFEDRTGTVMNAALPMTLDGHTAFAIDSISLRAKAESDCHVTLSVVLTDDEGQTRTVDIGSFFGEAGSAQVFRVKKRLPRAVKAELLVRTEGDVCLQSYRW